MRLGPFVLALLLAAAAVSMARALVTREGVGAGEDAAGIALVAGLLVLAARLGRASLTRR